MKRLLPLTLAVFAVACTEPHSACSLDSDCPADEVCDEHVCVAGSNPCGVDADCAGSATCRTGMCFAAVGDTCQDLDEDGYRAGSGCPAGETLDCDDTDPSVSPDAIEVCGDGIDNNCVGGDDEGCVGCSPPMDRPCGRGVCAGTQHCDELGWQDCLPLVTPEMELCGNGLDDDCDGEVDNGCACCTSDADCVDGLTCDGCYCVP